MVMGALSLSGSDDAPGDGDAEFEVELGAAELLLFCSGNIPRSPFDFLHGWSKVGAQGGVDAGSRNLGARA